MTDHTPHALGERGLQRAMARLDAELSDGQCPLVSLAEVLHWLDGLARWHRDTLGARVYDARHDDDHDGRALAGVRYVYAAIERDATRVGRIAKFGGPGADPLGLAQLSGALAGRTWRWQRREALPPPPPTDPAAGPEAAGYYARRVAKRPLAQPLWAATRFLTETLGHDVVAS